MPWGCDGGSVCVCVCVCCCRVGVADARKREKERLADLAVFTDQLSEKPFRRNTYVPAQ